MACRILRNDDGTVSRVLASNNEPSILYQNIRNTMSEEEALLEYAGTFTDEFQNIVNYLKETDNISSIYDVNNEVYHQIYNYIMHPEKFFGQSSNIIKQGVSELFESNPELANAVYEAMGFDAITDNVLKSEEILIVDENEIPKKEGESFAEMQKRVTQNINIKKRIEIANKNNIIQGKSYSYSEIKKIFNDDNLFDNEIYKQLSTVLQSSNLVFRFGSLNKGKKTTNAYYNSITNSVNIDTLVLQSPNLATSDFKRILLHEIIHAATFINLEENANLTSTQKTALNNLNNLITELNEDRDFFAQYGLTNANELLAELANTGFVDKLKNKTFKNNQSFFDKIISEIVKLLGLNTTAYDIVKESFDNLVKEYKGNNQITPQQKQQAQQAYSNYLESLDKPNTNPVLQGNQQEQVKKFAELQERLNNKEFIEGAKFTYESSESSEGSNKPAEKEVTAVLTKINESHNLGEVLDFDGEPIYNFEDTVLQNGLVNLTKNQWGHGATRVGYGEEGLKSLENILSKKDKFTGDFGPIAGTKLSETNKYANTWETGRFIITRNNDSFYSKDGSLNTDGVEIILNRALEPYANYLASKYPSIIFKDAFGKVINNNQQSQPLKDIGTQEQYNDYIAKVSLGIVRNPSSGEFNSSAVKDIVYHGTNNQDKQEFKKDRAGYLDKGFLGKGFYSTFHKNYTKAFGSKTYGLLLNIKKPLLQTNEKIDDFLIKAHKAQKLGYDSVFQNFSYDENLTIEDAEKEGSVEYNLPINKSFEQVVFEPEQIHILGGKQDIQGFKEFVDGSNTAQFNQIQNNTNENIAADILEQITSKISKNLNSVPYSFITEEDAISILSETQEKYNGQPAFFYNGQVYLIKDKLNLENIFHEFSHPFIKAIKKSNPSLFNKLYDTLLQTEEGQKIKRYVQEFYKYDESSEDFKEEVLVRALTTKARNNELKVQESSGFTKLIDKLLYTIKQLMRKIFGKIKIDKLNANTTLEELAKMLNNESFEISTDSITESDKVQFNILQDSVKDMIDRANDTLVQNNIDEFFKLVGSSKQVIKDAEKKFPGIQESISKMRLEVPFESELKGLFKYQTYTKINEAPIDLVSYRQKQIESLVISLESYNDSITKIIDEINRQKSDPDSIITIAKNDYYLKILLQTLDTFKNIREQMQDAGVPISAPIFQLLNKTTNNADNGTRIIYQENKITMPKILAPHLKGINEVVTKEFNKVIDEMRSRGSSVEAIAAKERERDSYLRDENTLAKILVGETPEPAGLGLSTLVESAVSSPDELISSFALYVKEALIDVELNAITNYNDFLSETRSLLKDAGLDDFKLVSKLGKIITYTEEVGYKDSKTGEFKTQKVHRFLNKFKGYEVVLSKYRYDIETALENDDLELAANIEFEREEWKRKYMHDEYTPEVYTMYDIFKKTYVNSAGVTIEIGKMAREKYDKIMEDINNGINLVDDELERIEIQNRMKIDTLWVEYKKLFSKYDNNGNLKVGDDLAITETLLEYRAKRKEFFEFESDELPDSMPFVRFQKARKLFSEQLLTKYERNSDQYREKLREWDDMNTRKVIDKLFYTDKALILEKINAIYNSMSGSFTEDSKIVEKTKEYWNLIIDQLYAYRDEENHPNGILVSKEKIAAIKEAQEKIQELQDLIKNGNGLSRGEAREYRRLSDLSERGVQLSDKEYSDLEKLEIRSQSTSMPKGIKDELKLLYEELTNLQSKTATDYYQEVYNYQIDLHNTRLATLGLPVTVKHFDRFDIDDLALDRGFVESIFKKDAAFKEWFTANHIEVERWDDMLQMRVKRFERLFLWNQIEPNDVKYKKKMVFRDHEGEFQTIFGLPSLMYYKQNIKPEFKTKEVVGETIDNRGNFLPRFDVANSPYINQDYINLKNDNVGAFNILEKIKEFHLKFQEKANKQDRLYMDVPRYEKTSKELTETNKFLSDKSSTVKSALKNFINKFKPNAEDIDEGLNIEDKFKLTKLDFFNNDEQKIHVSGKSLMDDDQVSLDVITSIIRHMHSIERASKLSEIEPVSKALMQLLNDPKNQPKDITKASLYQWITNKVPVFANKKGENIRAKAVKGLIDRTFYNVQQTGFGSDAIVLQKLSKVMMQAASFGFFALDIPSGFKNRFGQQLQQTIELASGTSYDAKSFMKGKMIASQAMAQISGSIYNKGKLPYYAQLVNAFDPSQGMAMDKLPEYITRTIYKDVAAPSNVLMSPRKFLELEATLEFFFGVMEFTKIEQTKNGVTTEISYHEAFELVNDRLTLKEGIDEKWGLGGSEFKKKRIFIQEKQNILNGVYSKFDQPEGNRYLFYRMFQFLRKFFITGLVNRYGFSGSLFKPRFRRNNASQTLEMGYWIQSARNLSKLLITMGKHWHFMRPSEKGALYKSLTEIALLTILSALIPMLFGWDDDDEDRYAKLRKRQGGPLGSKDFEFAGWFANHLLYQTMTVASENTQFYKIDLYSDMMSNFNLANGPSLETYGKIISDIIMMLEGDEGAYYKKDVGPYSWQKKESAKILNHIGKAFSLTGKTRDPQKAIQDFKSAENIN